MFANARSLNLAIALTSIVGSVLHGQQAQAQMLVPDGVLPTQISPDSNLNQFTVTGGQAQGVNLFHGFETFSPGDWSVRFDLNATPIHRTIERIFSRVTGNQSSLINGTISIGGGNSPDLFLVNPNGILFGPEARLDLAGSFIGSTAEAIQFADGSLFSHSLNSTESPLLSISAPVGLQMGQRSGAIAVQGAGHQRVSGEDLNVIASITDPSEAKGLKIDSGNSFILVAQEITLEGGIIQPSLAFDSVTSAPLGGGQFRLGAVSEGTVRLQPGAYGIQLDYADIAEYGDIRLSDRALLESTGQDASRIELRGKNITLDDGSILSLNSFGNQSDPDGLTINATESISLLSRDLENPFVSVIQNQTLGPGKGADINLQANNLLLEGGVISNSTLGSQGGQVGDVNVLINQDINIKGIGRGVGFASSATISSSSIGTGEGGRINIEARNLTLENGGIILSAAAGVPFNAQAEGNGNGGEIKIQVQDATRIRGFSSRSLLPSGINSSTLTTGDAGNISLTTQRLELDAGGIIQADSFSQGRAGNVSVQAAEFITLSGIANNALANPSQISSSVTPGSIQAFNDIFDLPSQPSGDGGNVVINTPELNIRDRALVSVINRGTGDAGGLEIEAPTLNLSEQARIVATTEAGNGGSIRLSAGEALTLRDRSEISATAGGEGNGGNIFIQTPNLIAVPQENSDITADAANRFGGAIEIDAANVLGLSVESSQTLRSDITASSGGGPQFSGTVELTQTQTRPNERLTELPSRFADQSDRLAQGCDVGENQLAVTNRGGLAQVDPAARALSQQYGNRGHAYEQQQQWPAAEENSIQALKISQAAQNPFQSYQWAWQLARIAQARWKNTGDELFRRDAIAYYQESLNSLKVLRSELAQRDQAEEFSFRTNIEPVYREYVSLLLPQSSVQAASAMNDLQAALNAIEALKLAELDDFFQDACLRSIPRSIENLDPNAAVVYPIVLKDRVEVIVSHQGALKRHSISITPERFEALVKGFRRSLVHRSSRNYQRPGKLLYDALIQPLLANLEQSEIETLVFVPDKSLKNIPMGALFDGEEYLIEQFNVVVAPSLELLPGGSQSPTESKALLAGITKRHQGFPPLPYVQQEIEQLEALFPGEQLLDEGFTREALTKALQNTQTSIVHIATHGQFSSDASQTYVLAWNDKIRLEELYELLRARDRNSLTPTELLVLSACETASGDEAAALGLAGVAVRAGARSTLASLWSVNDQSTTFLMAEFYQQLSQGTSNKSAALREAQLELLKHPIYRHPYYWSAFILIGNWQ